MSAKAAFRALLLLAGLTAVLMALPLLMPFLVGRTDHHAEMSPTESLIACLVAPSFQDWHIPALVALPLALLGYAILYVALFTWKQWHGTRLLVRALLMHRVRRPPRPFVQLLSRLGLKGRVDLVAVSRPLAFCYGWAKPRICISSRTIELLSAEELEAVLLHEQHHLHRRDPIKNLLSQAFAHVFFFVPVIRDFGGAYALGKEIEADRHAIALQESEEGLLSALAKLLLHQSRSNPSARLAVAGVEDCLVERIEYLLTGATTPPTRRLHMRHSWFSAGALALFASIVIVVGLHASEAAAAHKSSCTVSVCAQMQSVPPPPALSDLPPVHTISPTH